MEFLQVQKAKLRIIEHAMWGNPRLFWEYNLQIFAKIVFFTKNTKNSKKSSFFHFFANKCLDSMYMKLWKLLFSKFHEKIDFFDFLHFLAKVAFQRQLDLLCIGEWFFA